MEKRIGREHRAGGEITSVRSPGHRHVLAVGQLFGGVIAYADHRLTTERLDETRKPLLAEKELSSVDKGLVQCHINLFLQAPGTTGAQKGIFVANIQKICQLPELALKK